MSGIVQIVLPEDGANLILNPSFEAAGNYSAFGPATLTRTVASATTPTRYGWYTLRLQAAGDHYGVLMTTKTLANAVHYFSCWLTGAYTSPTCAIGDTYLPLTLIEADGAWKRYGTAVSAAECSGRARAIIVDAVAGADFYIDGCLLEAKSYATTYFDGDTTGCRWTGVKHASASLRYSVMPGTALTNVGHGRLVDIDTPLGIGALNGLGLPDVQNLAQDQALIPGKVYYATQFNERTIGLTLRLSGTSLGDLHSLRKQLLQYLQIGDPFVLRYLGADTSPGTTRTLEITAKYASGLPFSLGGKGFTEQPSVALTCLDPIFRQTGESALYLTSYSATASSDALFARTDSAWARLGSGSGLSTIADVKVAADGRVFACGGATVKVWDGASWTTIATVTGGSATVASMTVGLQGDYLYVTGSFTSVSGTAANYIARYDLAAGTWSALGTGLNAAGNAVHATKDGLYVIVVGGFTTAGGAASVAVARWVIASGSWSAFAAQPASGTGYGVDSYANGDIVVCGNIPAFGNIIPPAGTPTATYSASGGYMHGPASPSGATVTYQITAITLTGETIASAVSATANLTNTSFAKITVGWNAATGATGYKVYRKYNAGGVPGDSQGVNLMVETQWSYIATTTATSYVDDGSVSDGTFTAYPAHTPPTTPTDGMRSVGIARWQARDNTWRTVGKPGGPGFTAAKIVYAVKVGADGQGLYAALASDCTTVDGLTVAGVAYCKNGSVWYGLSSGLSGGHVTAIDADETGVWFGGAHTSGGPTAAAQLAYLARWVGQENGIWLPADIAPGGAVTALAHVGVTRYAGLAATGTPTVAASASVTYGGTFANWPRIEMMGPLTLTSVENATVAARLVFAPTPLAIAAGETVTIQLYPTRFGVTSSTRGLLRAVLSGASDTAGWRMRPGANQIVVYGTGSTAATVVRIIDSVAHLSVDAAAA